MKLSQRILSRKGIAYLEKEIDQWVCYTDSQHWFPGLECQTCISSTLSEVWTYAKETTLAPTSFLESLR